MVTVPLGVYAFKRLYTGSPEIKLINRYLEANPTNLKEQIALIGRPGTDLLANFSGGAIRRTFSKKGLFDSALFVISGGNLWRQDPANSLGVLGAKTQITGTVPGSGHPYMTWSKGIGYEYLFIADGLTLQYYGGGTHATGTLTDTGGAGSITNAHIIEIGGTYYGWNANVNTGTPAGTSANPWLALLGANDDDSLDNMAQLLNYEGTIGVDFSSGLPGPSTIVTAAHLTPTTLTVTARTPYANGNAITTSTFAGANLTWGGATLSGGGTHALVQIPMPDGQPARALAALDGYVLVSVNNSRRFYFIPPGMTTIDPLDFAEKESNPDNIIDMLTVGDSVMICGEESTEAWYGTGDADLPFAPTSGRAFARGILDGTPVVVNETVILVGNDGIVYDVGSGVRRISNNGIEERIRTLLRSEQGLS